MFVVNDVFRYKEDFCDKACTPHTCATDDEIR